MVLPPSIVAVNRIENSWEIVNFAEMRHSLDIISIRSQPEFLEEVFSCKCLARMI